MEKMMEGMTEEKETKGPTVVSVTFGQKLKGLGIGCLKAILFLGIVVTQPVRWVLKLIIWPFIKLARNIYCRVRSGNTNKDAGEENTESEGASKQPRKSVGQKFLGVITELCMFVGGYVFSALRRIFISDACGLYSIARNESFFGYGVCRMNSFCDGVVYDNDGKCYRRLDGHQGDSWGCSGEYCKFHLADYLRYISGYSDVLNKNFLGQNSIIRKMECCCLSEDSPEMYC